MATKYCDHGAYAESASFTASLSGFTLTVSSVSSGRIGVGSVVVCAGFTSPAPLYVSALGTGTGGTGTYTVNHNSNGAVASQSMTSTGARPFTTPVWGVAQDGDGSAKDPGAPSTAEVVFTGVPSSGTIAVLGVVLSPTWATNANTCANNLATAINASSATAVSPASFTIKSQVRNHVYARGPALGAPSGTCQIMTRQASANHAGSVAVTHTLNNVSSPATVNFSGGFGGCWGWVTLPSGSWPSGTVHAYGLLCADRMFCGSVAGNDLIHLRSGKMILGIPNANSISFNAVVSLPSTSTSPITIRVDDGTVWPDGSEPVFTMLWSAISGSPKGFFTLSPASSINLVGKRYSDSKYAFQLRSEYGSTGQLGWDIGLHGGHRLEGFDVYAEDGYFVISSAASTLGANGYGTVITKFRIRQKSQTVGAFVAGSSGGGVNGILTFTDGVVDAGSPTAAQPAVVNPGYGSGQTRFYFEGVRFKNFVVGSRLTTAATTTNTHCGVTLRNCDYGGITVFGPSLLTSTATPSDRSALQGNAGTSSLGSRDFFLDTPRGWASWISTRTFPTLNARLNDGITPWSIQVIPTVVSTNISPMTPFYAPRVVKINTLGAGIKTLSVEFGIEQSLAWTRRDFAVIVEYEDEAGNVVVMDTYDPMGGAFDASSALWTNADGAQFTYSESGVLYFNKFKFSLTTPTVVKAGSEIGVTFKVCTSVSDQTKMLFIDPNVVIS